MAAPRLREKLAFAAAMLLGFIRRPDTRRQGMFLFTLAAVCCLFAGATFLEKYLTARPLLFLCYWGLCAWLTLCSLLLALYDMLAVSAAASRERRRLREELRASLPLKADQPENGPGSRAP